jgi:hypothetical protein
MEKPYTSRARRQRARVGSRQAAQTFREVSNFATTLSQERVVVRGKVGAITTP